MSLLVFCFGGEVHLGKAATESNHQQRGMEKYNAQTHVQLYNVMFMVCIVWTIPFKKVGCKDICKFTPNLNLKRMQICICHCSPILKWSNIETKCIFLILAFF